MIWQLQETRALQVEFSSSILPTYGYRLSLFGGVYRFTWFGAFSQHDWTLPYEGSLRLFWQYLTHIYICPMQYMVPMQLVDVDQPGSSRYPGNALLEELPIVKACRISPWAESLMVLPWTLPVEEGIPWGRMQSPFCDQRYGEYIWVDNICDHPITHHSPPWNVQLCTL